MNNKTVKKSEQLFHSVDEILQTTASLIALVQPETIAVFIAVDPTLNCTYSLPSFSFTLYYYLFQ